MDAPERHRFETTSFDRAHERLRQTWVEHTPRLRSERADFTFSDATVNLGHLVAEHIDYHADADVRGDPLGDFTIAQLHSGTIALATPAAAVHAGPGCVFCFPPDAGWKLEVHEPEVSCLRFELSALRAAAGELAGIDPSALRFEDLRPVSQAHQRHWLTVVRHVGRDVLAHDEVLANPLVRAETFRHLAVTALSTFPNTALAALTDPQTCSGGWAEPAVLRRAIEFIEAHAHEPIGLGEIAAAARIGPRGLQREFRRHRNCTPLGFLRRVRLERAHRDLGAADPSAGDSVAEIAARWGFAHSGRFAAEYLGRYGCSPSYTLRH